MSQFQDVRAAYAGSWKRRSVFVPLYMALRLLTVAIIAPGVAAAIDLAVSLSDQSALTDQDIAMFILSPVGFLATLAAVSLFLVGEVIGFSVMTASIRAQSPSIWQAGAAGLSLVIVRARSLIEFAARFVLKVLVLVAPFVVVAGAIAWWTLTEYDINYYLTFKPPSYWVAVVLIGAILLCMVWVLIRRLSGWSLALHLVLFDASRPSEAFGESETRMQGRRGKLKISLVLWLGVRLLLAGIIASVAGLAIGIVPFGDQGNLRIALRLTFAIVVIWSLAGIVLAAVALGALAVLLDGFFDGPVQVPEPRSRRNLRPTLMVCVAGAAGLTMASIWMGNQVLEQIETDHEVAVIGHRGAAAARPENTMASVLKAIEDGADWVEIDVQETADDVIVVMHDSDYMKLAGVN
ncbi:MAG: glycerophosphodiester phosphodiesterase family protein, partial [Pseudomonadota bacterium]